MPLLGVAEFLAHPPALADVLEVDREAGGRGIGPDLEPGLQRREVFLEVDRDLLLDRPAILAVEAQADRLGELVPDDPAQQAPRGTGGGAARPPGSGR